MKKFLLFLSITVFFGFTIDVKAQLKKFSNDEEKPKELYPVHVSDRLNNHPGLQELARSKANAAAQKRTKAIVVDEVGDAKNFFVSTMDTDEFEEKSFRLIRKGGLTQIWFEIAEMDNGHLDEKIADSLFKYLEEESNQFSFNPNRGIIDLSNDVLGGPPNYDGDDLVDFLITDIQDGWDPDENGGYTAGFFYSVDQFTDEEVQDATPQGQPLLRSNERDILYIDSYPGIFRSENTEPTLPLSTLSHEYQHLIHWAYNGGLDNNEYTFVNEAQSNFASLLVGYFPHTSYPDYLDDTNIPIFRWNRDDVFADYGRAASFTSYLWDQLGFENAGHLTQDPLSGASGINSAVSNAGSSLEFGDILVNWGIANLINDITVDRTYGYEHTFLDEFTATVNFQSPNISDDTVKVQQGGIAYIGFQQAENLNINISYSGSNGRARLITKSEGSTEIHVLESGVDFSIPSGEVYDEAIIMLVNTTPSPNETATTNTLDFVLNTSGNQMYDLSTASTYSEISKFYWEIPTQNISGFSNKFIAETDALLHSLELYLYSNQSGDIGVKGNGQLKIAAFTNDNGIPGAELASDTIDFEELGTGWQNFNVTDWDINLEQGQVIHIVYEASVATVNTDINSIPLMLDDGTGEQEVSFLLTTTNEFAQMFEDEDTGGQHGVFNTITLAQAVDIEDEFISVPINFELSQNYPNPFNPSTSISFSLPKASEVQLTIYNTLGQQVATLLNERMTTGSHTVSWDAQHMASGVYLYKIQAGNFIQTRKMILLK